MTRDGGKERDPGSHGGRFPDSPAKVPGDRDEAKALPDDIAVNERGGPDADVHYPAMASTVTDEEAGSDLESSGRIQPLKSKGSTPGSSGSKGR